MAAVASGASGGRTVRLVSCEEREERLRLFTPTQDMYSINLVLDIMVINIKIEHYRGEILRPPENSVPQTTVFRYQEIGDILCTKQRSNGIVFI
jgi:hypothetical protein